MKTGITNRDLNFLCLDLNRSSKIEEVSAKKDAASPYQPKATAESILTVNNAKKVLSRFFFFVFINTRIEIRTPKIEKFKPKYSS